MGRRPGQKLTFAPGHSAAAELGPVWVDQDLPMVLACQFPHERKVSRFELGSVPGERLKRQLVQCLFTMSEPDRGVGSSSSAQHFVVAMRAFLRFLAGKGVGARGLDDLGADVVDRFQDAMVEHYGSESSQPCSLVSALCALLREAVEEHGATLSPALQRRLAFGATCAKPATVPRDAYTLGEARAIAHAARRDVGRVMRRLLGEGPALLATGGHPDHSAGGWHSMANVAWYLDNHGDRTVAQLREESRGAFVPSYMNRLSTARRLLWPTPRDLVGFWALLLLQSELTPASAALLTIDCLANPSAGKVTIRHHKYRAGRSRSERVARVPDGQGTSPGGLVRNLVRAGERARRWAGSDALWVAVTERSGFTTAATEHFRVRNAEGRSSPLQQFALDYDLVWESPAPGTEERLALHGSRLRKTYVAAAYRAVGGDIAATAHAAGNTPPVAMRHYGDIASLGPLHAWTVSDALYERVEAARAGARSGGAPVVVGTRASSAPEAGKPSAGPGLLEVQLAGCRGFFDSPFGTAGEGCPVSFTGCLQCRNAVISAGKLPAVVTYLHHILGQRFLMGEEEWCEAWGADFVRIVDDVLPRFDEATLAAAQEQARSADGAGFYLPTVATARRYRHG